MGRAGFLSSEVRLDGSLKARYTTPLLLGSHLLVIPNLGHGCEKQTVPTFLSRAAVGNLMTSEGGSCMTRNKEKKVRSYRSSNGVIYPM